MPASVLDTRHSLANLTKDNCLDLFAQAFGYTPGETNLEVERYRYCGNGKLSHLDIQDNRYYLMIYPNGKMESYRITDSKVEPVPFNAVHVVNTLNTLGVNWELADTLHQDQISAPEGEESELIPESVVGPKFKFEVLRTDSLQQESLLALLMLANHWAAAKSTRGPQNLREFKARLIREMGYMLADGQNLKELQVQWLDEDYVLAIGSFSTPVMVFATISLTEP